MNNFQKIHIYAKHYSRNRKHPQRPSWFDYDKCFGNLLATTNFNICDLTIVFEKEEDYDSYFVKRYEHLNRFKTKFIDTSREKWIGLTHEDKGWSRGIAAVSKAVHEDNLSENDLVYLCDDDYLHIPFWSEICLDYANLLEGNNWWICPCDYGDKYYFIDEKHTIDQWGTDQGMYAELVSKIRLSHYRHWRQVPSCLISSMLPVSLFNRDYNDYWSMGYSDCEMCGEFGKKFGTSYWTPIPSLSCHVTEPFLSPFFDWKTIMEEIRIKI